MTEEKPRVSADLLQHMEGLAPSVVHDAAAATERQKSMTFSEAIRLYPKAVLWSIILSTSIVMEGFDLVLIGSFFAFPQFTQHYGERQPDGSYQVLTSWQSALTNGALVGQIIGLAISGWIVERWGYRLVAMIAFIFIPFFSTSIGMLVTGEVLCGLPWGAFQAISTAYAADICPVSLRAYLTTYVNLCFVMGQLLSTGILRAFIQIDGQWAYRIPFGLQWIWPVPILIGCFLAPESPWWLVRHGRQDEAKAVLSRLRSGSSDEKGADIDCTLAMIIYTNESERQQQEGTSYLECFQKTNLRRTEIASMTYASQMICGSSLMGYSVYFYQQAGLPTKQALNLSIGQFAIGFVGTVLSWWLMGMFGRRTLYLLGTCMSLILLVTMGAVGIPKQTEATTWAAGSLLLVLTFFYDISIGPITFCIVAEIPSTRLRAKTVVVARCLYNVSGLVCNILTPRMINPTAWGWGAKAGFFWAGITLCCLVWMFFRLPEPNGRTYGELDILFEHEVPARQFATTAIAQLGGNGHSIPSKGTEAN
ncbi:hypothetical protein FOVSG1_009938 [Fusarium oxysporum f. sp. vasinfectum]